MKKLTFWRVVEVWFITDLLMMFINGATLKSSLLASVVHASLGVFLLINPLYPERFEWFYSEEKAKGIIRFAAVLEILSSFLIRIKF